MEDHWSFQKIVEMVNNLNTPQMMMLTLSSFIAALLVTAMVRSVYKRISLLQKMNLGDPIEDVRQYFPLGSDLAGIGNQDNESQRLPTTGRPDPTQFGLPQGFRDEDILLSVLFKHIDLSPLTPTFESMQLYTVGDILAKTGLDL